jgi:hypothetical protein
VQRLKQNNIGAQLWMSEETFLLGFRRPQPFRGSLRVIRIHVELGGFAERAYHEIGRASSHFSHRSVQLESPAMERILAALRAAHAEQPDARPGPDPNGDYRTLEYRDGSRQHTICTECDGGRSSPNALMSEAVWALLEGQFPSEPDA